MIQFGIMTKPPIFPNPKERLDDG